MNPNESGNTRSERKRAVRIAALIVVILMGGLIVASVVVSLLGFENSGTIVVGLLSASFFLGVMIYLVGLFSKLSKKKNEEKR